MKPIRCTLDTPTHTKMYLKTFQNKKNLSHLRWTLDTKEDLILIKKIINNIQARPIILKDILNYN